MAQSSMISYLLYACVRNSHCALLCTVKAAMRWHQHPWQVGSDNYVSPGIAACQFMACIMGLPLHSYATAITFFILRQWHHPCHAAGAQGLKLTCAVCLS